MIENLSWAKSNPNVLAPILVPRHALRSRSPSGYAMAMVQSKELFGRIKELAQESSTRSEDDQNRIQVVRVAQELLGLMNKITTGLHR